MSVIEQAKIEMELAGINGHDQKAMLIILHIFFEQWDSGGAVAAMAPVLAKLIAAKPLGPLTGADSEWFQPMDDMEIYQNRRCGSVFKERAASGELIAFDIEARPPDDADPVFLADRKRVRYPIAFPYMPAGAEVPWPVAEIGGDDAPAGPVDHGPDWIATSSTLNGMSVYQHASRPLLKQMDAGGKWVTYDISGNVAKIVPDEPAA